MASNLNANANRKTPHRGDFDGRHTAQRHVLSPKVRATLVGMFCGRPLIWKFILACCLLPQIPAGSWAQEPTTSAPAASPPAGTVESAAPADPGVKWAWIICGHPGDEEHRAMYAETIESLFEALSTRLGFARERILVQFGSEKMNEDGPALAGAQGTATVEELKTQAARLGQQIKPADTLWTIVLGHAHFDGRHSYLNLLREDMHEDDFAALFAELPARRQVFFITTPVSGYFLRPLAGEHRIVITATEADAEVNETLFHAGLAEVLSAPPEEKEFDADQDGRLTLFDLYITVTRNVARRYVGDMLLATEHAQLDDNGDGRGTELQLDYLTDEEGGRAQEGAKPPPIRPNADGAVSVEMVLEFLSDSSAVHDMHDQ